MMKSEVAALTLAALCALAALTGCAEQGPQGEQGVPGPQGPRGTPGPEGPAPTLYTYARYAQGHAALTEAQCDGDDLITGGGCKFNFSEGPTINAPALEDGEVVGWICSEPDPDPEAIITAWVICLSVE